MKESLRGEKISKTKSKTITNSKTAQTQLKTALRNHIDLSSIADNKANIMLSVNAMILTVGLPLIISQFETDSLLVIPTAILAFSSLGSMVLATLSTRPIKMNGSTRMEEVKALKSNLFFFGNFYKMNFEEYESGMKTVVGNDKILDNSITRDLFFIGKSLGKKYDRLRLCYNIFMYGVGLALTSYIVIFVLE